LIRRVPRKRVLILGASRYYSRSIAAARMAGYFVIALDRNASAEGFSAADLGIACDIVDRDRVLDIARDQRVDGIVPLNDYGVPTAAHVATRLGLPGISEDAAHLATDKAAMRRRWRERGIPCPSVALATSLEEFREAVSRVGLPCILKPAHGIGGASRGVIVVRTHEELPGAIDFAQRFYADKATLVESFVEATLEHSAEAVIVDGKPHVIAISDKVKTPLPFRVDKTVVYPTAVDRERRPALIETIGRAIAALDIGVGAAHVELATTASGFVLFELGARCGGGGTPEPVVRYATGVDELVETVRVLVGDEPTNLVPTRHFGCVYHFLTPRPGLVSAVHGVEEVRRMQGVLDVEVFARPGTSINPVQVGLDRAGFVIAGAETRQRALAIAEDAERRIQFEYADT
jgi:biotin carboxylase